MSLPCNCQGCSCSHDEFYSLFCNVHGAINGHVKCIREHTETTGLVKHNKPRFMEYASVCDRKRSFTKFGYDAEEYSQAGFFQRVDYIPPPTPEENIVTCYYCGITLRVTMLDLPWTIHAQCAPTCEYMRVKKGDAFIMRHSGSTPWIQYDASGFQQTSWQHPEAEQQHPASSSEQQKDKMSWECPVCFESTNPPRVLMPCTHTACDSCVLRINTCPKCRELFHYTSSVFL